MEAPHIAFRRPARIPYPCPLPPRAYTAPPSSPQYRRSPPANRSRPRIPRTAHQSRIKNSPGVLQRPCLAAYIVPGLPGGSIRVCLGSASDRHPEAAPRTAFRSPATPKRAKPNPTVAPNPECGLVCQRGHACTLSRCGNPISSRRGPTLSSSSCTCRTYTATGRSSRL